jgi:hypothetical protein
MIYPRAVADNLEDLGVNGPEMTFVEGSILDPAAHWPRPVTEQIRHRSSRSSAIGAAIHSGSGGHP